MLYLACVTLPSSLLGCFLRLLYCTVLSQHHLLHHCMYHVLNKLCEAMLLVSACASSHGAKGYVSCSSQLSHCRLLILIPKMQRPGISSPCGQLPLAQPPISPTTSSTKLSLRSWRNSAYLLWRWHTHGGLLGHKQWMQPELTTQ